VNITRPSIPFTYLIGWKAHNVWYYGSKYAAGCNPSDLWTRYFTSSKYVKQFIAEFGDPDVIEIRNTFDTPAQATTWEKKVLRRMNVIHDDRWLNKSNATTFYIAKQSPEHISRRCKKGSTEGKRNAALKAGKIANDKRIGSKDSEATKIKRAESVRKTMAYNRANNIVTRKKRKIYLIDGIEYFGLQSVMDRYSISMPTVYNRIQNPNFPNWSVG